MNWRIIGRVAMYHWFPNDTSVPQDIDILTPAKIAGNNSNLCVVDTQWHNAAQLLIDASKDPVFLDADLLYTLKVSHAHWNVKWAKTMHDINFLKNKGCVLNMEIYKELFKVWSEVHGKKHVNMNKPMAEFFKDVIIRKYDHEQLHTLVAFNECPMHEILRKDHSTAWCSEDLFNELSFEKQCETALEEMLTVLIERNPNLTVDSLQSEKLKAASACYNTLVTSMTTGWFARFLILNHRELLFNNRNKWYAKYHSVLRNLNVTTI